VTGRIVITGAGGLVGRVLAGQARGQGRDVLALTSSDWDITDAARADQVAESVLRAGDVVVNCAAFTAVDAAEAESDRAQAVNVGGAENVARTCARVGASLIHLSTDYVFSGVFDGEPHPYDIDDPTAPLSVYGRTKLAGELAVLLASPTAHVVRTSWVYEGADGSDFAAGMRRAAMGSETVDVVVDQIGSPTYVADLCAALLEVADGDISEPVLHAANGGGASRFEQAQAIFAELDQDPDRVRPVDSDRHPRPAPRPSYSVLSPVKSAAAGLTPLRPWRDALAEALATGSG
jgi:dTDP-4-dehydrorhamnose reductase